MDTLEAIHTRRSIRKYQAKPVSDGDIHEILAAAMQAPSAMNEQPWQFLVIKDRGILEKISSIHIYSRMSKDAALAILVCGDLSHAHPKGFWVQDCSAATQNLLLAAHAKGLGAVWCGIYPDEERVKAYKDLFNLPENIIPFAEVPMGYPAEHKEREDRFRKERVHFNKW